MSEGANALLSEETTAGNYFISNYPPYSFWNQEQVSQAHAALDRPPRPDAALGIYVHIPFCRKRCHFCYFKVYTGKDSEEIDRYLDAVVRELALYSEKPFIGGRKPSFIYFGGGTPSYISTRQLSRIVDAMKRSLAWDQAEEITFECEPGTITEGKLEILKQMGVTRLSLGIENFDDHVLEANGRAHGSREIASAYQFARATGFPQINIDLIAGMLGETENNWRECVRRTIEMAPDSVTVYQMEVPYNTTISKDMQVLGQSVAPVANWPTKRRWVDYAFSEMEKAGYTIASAYTAVKNPKSRFLYRDLLWTGADMIGLGVASFSHVNGTHYQNVHDWDPYIDRIHEGSLPIQRALTPTAEERMIREFILQMKLGHVHRDYFQQKFGVDVRQRFAAPLSHLEDAGMLRTDTQNLQLNRNGLLQVDRLLWEFFLPQHRGSRYA
ncbi:MAG TPA: coproporphyrinogen-III oxidase family protein [Bryobacteraceae bacterium]|nr:coproporphyrinogen-III oxidase family protein [Bryobacteraceae bacterium]